MLSVIEGAADRRSAAESKEEGEVVQDRRGASCVDGCEIAVAQSTRDGRSQFCGGELTENSPAVGLVPPVQALGGCSGWLAGAYLGPGCLEMR